MTKNELLAKAREAELEAETNKGAPMCDTWEQLAKIYQRFAALEPEAAAKSDASAEAAGLRSKRARRKTRKSSLCVNLGSSDAASAQPL